MRVKVQANISQKLVVFSKNNYSFFVECTDNMPHNRVSNWHWIFLKSAPCILIMLHPLYTLNNPLLHEFECLFNRQVKIIKWVGFREVIYIHEDFSGIILRDIKSTHTYAYSLPLFSWFNIYFKIT